MKILWITNIAFPESLELLNGEGELKSSGGWLIGAAESLCKNTDIHLTVATVSNQVKDLTRLKGKVIDYYLLPLGKGNTRVNHEYEQFWKQVKQEVTPDVIHLHGTEYSHGLAYLEACGAENVCVSIQGLVSACYYYYYYGLKRSEIRKAITPFSTIRGGIIKGYNDFKLRGEVETKTLKSVNHILGRTSWDRERTWAINPGAQYHYCGETLRSEFYMGDVWRYTNCRAHSIFISQASYPIKGLHMLLKAMPLVLRKYPDSKIRIAGADITRSKSWKELWKLSDYGLIVRKLIHKYNLDGIVHFTGPLDGTEMRKEYLKCNVFVCPSSIENSPNSLGEAQLLGVPLVASYVGGIMDMVPDEQCGLLYRFEETDMLAYKICQIFENSKDFDNSHMIEVAKNRHNRDNNTSELISIYKHIVNEKV